MQSPAYDWGRLLYDGIELVCLLCGYERYPEPVVRAFVEEAVAAEEEQAQA